MSYTKEELIENQRKKQRQYQREYNKRNPEIVNKNREKYYAINRERILTKKTCYCGCVVLNKNIERHEKTQKHFDLICLKFKK